MASPMIHTLNARMFDRIHQHDAELIDDVIGATPAPASSRLGELAFYVLETRYVTEAVLEDYRRVGRVSLAEGTFTILRRVPRGR